MKVFLDANVLVSVLNKEYPKFTYTSRVLSLAENDHFTFYTSALSLAISFYFASKKSGRKVAKEKIRLLSTKLEIASISHQAVALASENPKVHDLEDGFQYYASLEAGCECIVTDNEGDFYFSEIEVAGSKQFLEHHVL